MVARTELSVARSELVVARTDISQRRTTPQTMTYSINQKTVSGSKVESATNAGFNTTTFTMSAWCNVTRDDGFHWEGLMTINDGTANNRLLLVNSQNAGSRFLGYWDNNNGTNLTTIKLVTNVWNHIVLTKNGLDLTFYINGAVVYTITLAVASPTGMDRVLVGSGGLVGEYMEGNWTHARFFTSVLTIAEVKDLYYDGINPTAPSPLVEYKCTDGAGSTITDSSGNGLTGTITSSTWSTDVPTKARDNI